MKKRTFILDTDAGGDCDDMMALAYLVYAQRNLDIEIKAVTQSNGFAGSCALIRTVFEYFGEHVPMIGKMLSDKNPYDFYCSAVLQKFDKNPEANQFPDAVSVLRRALADCSNAILCAVGPLTNIAGLLESKADAISPLDGVSLVREKCAQMVVMAGGFVPDEDGKNKPEWNVILDVPAAKTLFRLCPVPIAVLPFETGLHMMSGKPMMDRFGEDTPLSLAFWKYSGTQREGGRHSWDPAAAVYAVEGCRDFFDNSLCGTVIVDDKGRTVLQEHEGGTHSILTMKHHDGMTEQECKDRTAAYIDNCAIKVHTA